MPLTQKQSLRILLCVALIFNLFNDSVTSAVVHVVVDGDGSLMHYAAVATALLHLDKNHLLRLVTVSGAGWGYPLSSAQHMHHFLKASDSTAMVAVGNSAPRVDAYNGSVHRGACTQSQGFPSTPRDAQRRGMPYSRADITSAFGKATRNYSLAAEVPLSFPSASPELVSLLKSLDTGDRITFVQVASFTNLDEWLRHVRSRDDARLLKRMYEQVEIHHYESGYGAAADEEAVGAVLSEEKLQLSIYPPLFFADQVSFTPQRWDQFQRAAEGTGVAWPMIWLHSALSAKKKRVKSVLTNDSAFASDEGSPAASMVVLCAVDSGLQRACHKYRTSLSAIHWDADTLTANNEKCFYTYGQNVTRSGCYKATLPVDSQNSRFLYHIPANDRLDGEMNSIAISFWKRWLEFTH